MKTRKYILIYVEFTWFVGKLERKKKQELLKCGVWKNKDWIRTCSCMPVYEDEELILNWIKYKISQNVIVPIGWKEEQCRTWMIRLRKYNLSRIDQLIHKMETGAI